MQKSSKKPNKNRSEELRQPEAGTVENVRSVEYYRKQCVREIGRLMSRINDASLPETRIKILNDQINGLLRKKAQWTQRVLDLGGRVPLPPGVSLQDELAQSHTYRYFGQAKFLPGVKEILVEKAALAEENAKKQSRAELFRRVGPEYFDFDDEVASSPNLRQLEIDAQKTAFCALAEAHPAAPNAAKVLQTGDHVIPPFIRPFSHEGGVPDQRAVENWLVAFKKELLLQKFVKS